MNGGLLQSGLQSGLQELASLPAACLEDTVRSLLRPTAVLGAQSLSLGSPLPALATLPPSAHLNLLLLLRAAPHRFSTEQRVALLQGLQRVAAAGPGTTDLQHASLVQLLAEEAAGSLHGQPATAIVPPCPSFLYTAQPCFPWAPVLTDAATAATLHNKLLREALRKEQKAQQAAGGAADDAAAAALGGTADGAAAAAPGGAADGAAAAAAGGKRPTEQGIMFAPKRPRSAVQSRAAPSTAGAAAAAEAELDAAVAAVKAALAAHAAGGAGELAAVTPELRASLDVLLFHAVAGSIAGRDALEEAGLTSLADDSLLLLLLSDLISATSSFARCRAAAAGLLLPRLGALSGPAPRDLTAAAQHAASANPQAFTVACLRPLLSSPGLNKHQAELLSAVLKATLPLALLPEAFAAACAAPSSGPGAAAGGAAWNEHTLGVLQVALSAKPPLGRAAVAQLAGACSAATAASAELAGSAKLAKLLLTLVKQYPSEATEAKQQLQAAAQATNSFMSKSLLAAVAKL